MSDSIYFLSDFHLGTPNFEESLAREQKIIQFLNEIESSATEIFLVGDIFDFWFEYKTVVPKGFVRLMGKLAELSDKGIKLHYFIGNHDMWTFGYLESELGVEMHRAPILIERQGKTILVGHGDGLGPGDHKYKMLKKIFRFPPFQWLFGLIHPDIGVSIANYWSRQSRYGTQKKEVFVEKQREWLYQYCCEEKSKNPKIDYFIFGHRHLALDLELDGTSSRYLNLGDWINFNTYAKLKDSNLELQTYNH